VNFQSQNHTFFFSLSLSGPLARFPQHCDQGLRVAAALPGLSEGGEVWRSDPEGYGATDGAVQPL